MHAIQTLWVENLSESQGSFIISQRLCWVNSVLLAQYSFTIWTVGMLFVQLILQQGNGSFVFRLIQIAASWNNVTISRTTQTGSSQRRDSSWGMSSALEPSDKSSERKLSASLPSVRETRVQNRSNDAQRSAGRQEPRTSRRKTLVREWRT